MTVLLVVLEEEVQTFQRMEDLVHPVKVITEVLELLVVLEVEEELVVPEELVPELVALVEHLLLLVQLFIMVLVRVVMELLEVQIHQTLQETLDMTIIFLEDLE